MTASTVALRTSSVLWFIWGAVHTFAGIMTMSLDTPEAIGGIADAVDKATLAMTYPDAAGAIINQHGWNLAWGGLVTMVCAVYVWRANLHGIVLAALVGGLLDIGYFLFLDLGSFVHFVPGTVMTLFSASAIALSAYGYRAQPRT